MRCLVLVARVFSSRPLACPSCLVILVKLSLHYPLSTARHSSSILQVHVLLTPFPFKQTTPKEFLAINALIRLTPLTLYKDPSAVLCGSVPKMAGFERYKAWLADKETDVMSMGGNFNGECSLRG